MSFGNVFIKGSIRNNKLQPSALRFKT